MKTLRGITAPGILGYTVMRRVKKRKNLSSARHYDQIRFRFRTAKTHLGRGLCIAAADNIEFAVRCEQSVFTATARVAKADGRTSARVQPLDRCSFRRGGSRWEADWSYLAAERRAVRGQLPNLRVNARENAEISA